jgi:hypothetical protein
MPTAITRGSASAKAFGFTNASAASSPGNPGLALSLSADSSVYTTMGITGSCTDPSGNTYISGFLQLTSPSLWYVFIAKYSTTGAFIWGFTLPSAGGNPQPSCAYYNGNIYFLNNGSGYIAYFSSTISYTGQVVNYYSYSGFSDQTARLFMDSSGNAYVGSSSAYIKINSGFASATAKSISTAGIYSWNGVYFGTDNSMHFSWYNSSTYKEGAAVSINSSGTAYNSYTYGDPTNGHYSLARTSDSSGNVYTATIKPYNDAYIIAETNTGTTLWSKTLTGSFLFVGTASLQVLDSASSVYFSPASAGSGNVSQLNLSTGALGWSKTYSTLTNYIWPNSAISNGNPSAFGFNNGGVVSGFIASPYFTGGKNGTYSTTTVSNTGATSASGVGITRGTFTPTIGSASSITLGSSSVTLSASAIFSTSNIATIPVS